jgi:hypothetical protein
MWFEESMAGEHSSPLVISWTSVLFSWHVLELDVSVLLAFCCMVQRENEGLRLRD